MQCRALQRKQVMTVTPSTNLPTALLPAHDRAVLARRQPCRCESLSPGPHHRATSNELPTTLVANQEYATIVQIAIALRVFNTHRPLGQLLLKLQYGGWGFVWAWLVRALRNYVQLRNKTLPQNQFLVQ